MARRRQRRPMRPWSGGANGETDACKADLPLNRVSAPCCESFPLAQRWKTSNSLLLSSRGIQNRRGQCRAHLFPSSAGPTFTRHRRVRRVSGGCYDDRCFAAFLGDCPKNATAKSVCCGQWGHDPTVMTIILAKGAIVTGLAWRRCGSCLWYGPATDLCPLAWLLLWPSRCSVLLATLALLREGARSWPSCLLGGSRFRRFLSASLARARAGPLCLLVETQSAPDS